MDRGRNRNDRRINKLVTGKYPRAGIIVVKIIGIFRIRRSRRNKIIRHNKQNIRERRGNSLD